MVLRSLAGEFARTTAGAWKAVAHAVDPEHGAARSATRPDRSRPTEPEAAPEGAAQFGPDQMLVPIDAWTRILEQVGNLHEAGQELADARERAAKAEAENVFLREQLRDLKADRAPRRRPAAAAAEPQPAEPSRPEPSASATAPPKAAERADRARARARQVRAAAGRWISPD